MSLKKTLLFLVLGAFSSTYAQKDGYWDKERATTKEVVISAGNRIVLPIEDLPVGTTEIVYRITLLDENQKLSSSLVSVLKAIPDPTGISQGSAGAVFLMSQISGDDKCTYALYSNPEAAKKYIETGKTADACVIQSEPVSKDARRITADKSSCFTAKSNGIYFGFESKNWFLKQKVVVEVVPWVDVKLNRGWNQENKKEIISALKTSTMAQKMVNADDFCICILDKIMKEYRFSEFQKLMNIEKNKLYKDLGSGCYNDPNVSKNIYNDLRSQATAALKARKYAEVISKLNTIIAAGKASVNDYSNIGYAYIITKQYAKAIKFLKEGEKLDETELALKLNLAHAYLVNDEYGTAKNIYKKYQDQNVNDSMSWKEQTKVDFEAFSKAGLPNSNFQRVLKLYN